MLNREEYKGMTGFSIWSAFIVLLITAIIGCGLGVMTPIQQVIMRESNQQSHQYVEAKQSMLVKLVTECEGLDVQIIEAKAAEQPELADALVGQRASIATRIREETELLPQSEIPRSVMQFIDNNK